MIFTVLSCARDLDGQVMKSNGASSGDSKDSKRSTEPKKRSQEELVAAQAAVLHEYSLLDSLPRIG